jgi:hypothetical protein
MANVSLHLSDDLLRRLKRRRQKAPVGLNFNLSAIAEALLDAWDRGEIAVEAAVKHDRKPVRV